MAEKKKRVWCTSKQKMGALDQLDKAERQEKFVEGLGVGNSTITD
jgi:hypothetical protein